MNVFVIELSMQSLVLNDAVIGNVLTTLKAVKGAMTVLLASTVSDAAVVHVRVARTIVSTTVGAVTNSAPFGFPPVPVFPSWTQNLANMNTATRRTTKSYQYFTTPLLMGVGIFTIVMLVVLGGVYGVGLTQTPLRWADREKDKPLPVPSQ